ncbi:MAG: DNA polymerase III subunit gamma/tau [Candidatus Schekmanbacteria bacterium]|nr:MAG: DNA polymerase III subunit gamma/tau [Candidatus Schekmanbacteria bacterium]
MSEESYLVLARKKRPQKFSEVIGQRHVTTTLQNAVKTGRIAHAFLLTGTRGVGKTTTARILAKALNCENGPAPEPCDECANCRAISEGSSLDVIEIDGASNRRIGEVRELREKAKFAPIQSRYKIYIIDEVHMLTTEAFNALLKTLEEPPPHVKFILATTDPNKLPPTILSRCQRYDFKTLPDNVIVEFLSKIAKDENIEIEDEALKILALSASGSVRDALSVFESIISFSEEGKITAKIVQDILGIVDSMFLADTVQAIVNDDAQAIIKLTSQLSERGYDVDSFCEHFLKFLRDIIVISAGEDNAAGTLQGLDLKKKLSAQRSFDEWLMLFNLFYECSKEIKRAENPFLVLEVSLLRCMRSKFTVPIDDILNKLSSSERESRGFPRNEDGSKQSRNRENKSLFESQSSYNTNNAKFSAKESSPPNVSAGIQTVPLSQSDKWNEFLRILEKRSIILNSIFSNGCRKVFHNNILQIFVDDDITYSTVNMGKNPLIISEAVKEAFGKEVKLKIEVEKKEKECNGKISKEEKKISKDALIAEAMEDRNVQAILNCFPSRIVDIKN